MRYTTKDRVSQLVGKNYSTADLDSSQFSELIASVEDTVDDMLREFCFPFNAYTDVPPTPSVIARATQHLAAGQAMRELGARNDNPELRQLESEGQALLDMVIRNQGRTDPEKVTGETLTFGTLAEAWMLDTHEAFIADPDATNNPLASGDGRNPPRVHLDTVEISSTSTTDGTFTAAEAAQFRRGVDFFAEFRSEYGKTVFVARDAKIKDNITTLKINYKWDYVKQESEGSRSQVMFIG